MHQLILLSILIATVAIPVRAARSADPVLGLKSAVLQMFGFELCYLVAVVYLYPRL